MAEINELFGLCMLGGLVGRTGLFLAMREAQSIAALNKGEMPKGTSAQVLCAMSQTMVVGAFMGTLACVGIVKLGIDDPVSCFLASVGVGAVKYTKLVKWLRNEK